MRVRPLAIACLAFGCHEYKYNPAPVDPLLRAVRQEALHVGRRLRERLLRQRRALSLTTAAAGNAQRLLLALGLHDDLDAAVVRLALAVLSSATGTAEPLPVALIMSAETPRTIR